jgi:hypothetical protein
MSRFTSFAVIAVLAAAAISIWAFSSGPNARYQLSAAPTGTMNVLDLTMKAGTLPSQQFDAH